EDRSAAGEHWDHGGVDVRDRREGEDVLSGEELDELLLDLLVEDRAAEETRPTRMCPPSRHVLRDRIDDLLIEVEAEVVAGCEVGEPLVADADPPAVDLVDDRVEHRVRVLEPSEIRTGGEP